MSRPLAHTFGMANQESRSAGYASFGRGLIFQIVAMFVALTASRAMAREVVENYSNGTPHFRYQVDAKNHKYGLYEELSHDGKLVVRGNYLNDQRTGAWVVYSKLGKPQELLNYRNDQLEGPYRYNYPSGLPQVVTTYHEDDFAGPITVNDEKGRVLRTITYPRRYDELEQTWTTLYPQVRKPVTITDQPKTKAPYDAGRIAMEDQQAGLNYTMLYRFASGLPIEKMTVEPVLIDRSQHAAVLLAKLGTVTKTPDQPHDMDDAFFKSASAGCDEGNLYYGSQNLFDAIDSFMDDSDEANVKEMPHRLGILNPGLLHTGFGVCDKFIVQHVAANARPKSFTFCAYPGQGYYPRQLLHKQAAWSVQFAGDKVRLASADTLAVRITPLDDHFAGAETVKADIVNTIDTTRSRVIIFRPKLKSLDGSRYYVEVIGLRTPSGATIQFNYLVDLMDMPLAEVKSGATTKAATKKKP